MAFSESNRVGLVQPTFRTKYAAGPNLLIAARASLRIGRIKRLRRRLSSLRTVEMWPFPRHHEVGGAISCIGGKRGPSAAEDNTIAPVSPASCAPVAWTLCVASFQAAASTSILSSKVAHLRKVDPISLGAASKNADRRAKSACCQSLFLLELRGTDFTMLLPSLRDESACAT